MAVNETQLKLSLEGWEAPFYEKLVQLDYFMENMQMDLIATGMKESDTSELIRVKFIELNERIQKEKKMKKGKWR